MRDRSFQYLIAGLAIPHPTVPIAARIIAQRKSRFMFCQAVVSRSADITRADRAAFRRPGGSRGGLLAVIALYQAGRAGPREVGFARKATDGGRAVAHFNPSKVGLWTSRRFLSQ